MKIKDDLSGLNNLTNNLVTISQSKTNNILTDDFIRGCSNFSSVKEFSDNIEHLKSGATITQEQLDSFVESNTKYKTHKEMLTDAFAESAKKMLLKGFK